ncbi:acyltransferase, partial [Porphyromonadaceae bacterium OttesenSCG-928-L07]|nr:acyltransferase [Porphyromonadaceae bacterium OttesenSCG-928-L07]
KRFMWWLINRFLFAELGLRSYFRKGILITKSCIYSGEGVRVGKNARIEGVFKYNERSFKPKIVFGNRVSIEQNIHLTCASKIEIGNNTAIAANVSITDIHHPYTNIDIPIERQDIETKEVLIGEDCKIYNNVVILPGVKIGKHVTIGANSVVNKDIPDYCVIAGIPAKIIKQYNFETKIWEKFEK